MTSACSCVNLAYLIFFRGKILCLQADKFKMNLCYVRTTCSEPVVSEIGYNHILHEI